MNNLAAPMRTPEFRRIVTPLIVLACLVMAGCGDGLYQAEVAQPELDYDATPMPAGQFWDLIEVARNAAPIDLEARRKALVDALIPLSENELKGFKLQYVDQYNRLMTNEVFTVFSVIVGTPDEEAFFCYRDMLISDGQDRVQEVIEQPQRILDDVDLQTTINIVDHGFYMSADAAIRAKLDDPDAAIWVPLEFQQEFSGEPVDLEDQELIKESYPELWDFIQLRNRIEEKKLFGG